MMRFSFDPPLACTLACLAHEQCGMSAASPLQCILWLLAVQRLPVVLVSINGTFPPPTRIPLPPSSEVVVGNVVRRVLHAIREEAHQQFAAPDVRSAHAGLSRGEEDGTEEGTAPPSSSLSSSQSPLPPSQPSLPSITATAEALSWANRRALLAPPVRTLLDDEGSSGAGRCCVRGSGGGRASELEGEEDRSSRGAGWGMGVVELSLSVALSSPVHMNECTASLALEFSPPVSSALTRRHVIV